MADSEADIIQRMREAAPFASAAEAKVALRVTLDVVSSLLTLEERNSLARALPKSLRGVVWRAEAVRAASTGGCFARIAARSGGRAGRAVEEAEVVCGAIGQTMSASVRAQIAAALPELARFLRTPAAAEPPPVHVGHPPSVPHDLAEGRPGGRHQLADAHLLERAHRHSVARSDDPHADTKLSSTRGLTQEREGHSLSTGESGSLRPLSREH